MLVATLRLKLKADPSNKFQPKVVAQRQKDPFMAHAYGCQISNSLGGAKQTLCPRYEVIWRYKKWRKSQQEAVRLVAIQSGVRESCVAASDLFNNIADFIIGIVSGKFPGIRQGSYKLADMEYADDIVILSSFLDELKQALTIQYTKLKSRSWNWRWTGRKLSTGPYSTLPKWYSGTESVVVCLPTIKCVR